jgi:2-methylisocitrate lyase-like PEP mutase family enzyme
MPNPWDAGSAVYLQSLGFAALASTSAGFAWTQGREDNDVTRDQVLAHLRVLVNAVDVPVNADFEGGFAHEPDNVAANVTLAIDTGVAGLSIEDFTGDEHKPLYEFNTAVDRIRAARAAIDAAGVAVVLTARTESILFGQPELGPIIRRLTAFADAGGDCLFAPGLRNLDDIRAVVMAVSPKPVNIMGAYPELTVQALANVGVRRISTGGALARSAWNGFMAVASDLAVNGTMAGFNGIMPSTEINKVFAPKD